MAYYVDRIKLAEKVWMTTEDTNQYYDIIWFYNLLIDETKYQHPIDPSCNCEYNGTHQDGGQRKLWIDYTGPLKNNAIKQAWQRLSTEVPVFLAAIQACSGIIDYGGISQFATGCARITNMEDIENDSKLKNILMTWKRFGINLRNSNI